jgi:hypothetical protein
MPGGAPALKQTRALTRWWNHNSPFCNAGPVIEQNAEMILNLVWQLQIKNNILNVIQNDTIFLGHLPFRVSIAIGCNLLCFIFKQTRFVHVLRLNRGIIDQAGPC